MAETYQSMKTPDEYTNAAGQVEWANVPLEAAIERLRTSREGLTSAEADKRLAEFGPNKLPEEKVNPLLIFLGFMWNPLSWAMEVAAIIAIVLLDYPDFALIVFLLLLNACIGFFEEMQAGNAVAALMDQLAPESKVLRDGNFVNLPADKLVPGDVIRVRLGDVVPADLKLLEGDTIKVDQSSLTGESLPVSKTTGDEAFSGSVVKQGEIEAIVTETGVNTFLGRAATLMNEAESSGRLQIVLTTVGNFCMVSIIIWCIIELAVQFGGRSAQNPCVLVENGCEALQNILVPIVGGIPVAMPTVLSVTMAIGSTKLAKQNAIVTRLTAIEEMASMEILCSDKTGTLTLNQLTVDMDNLIPYNNFSAHQIMYDGALAARIENNEPIDVCIHNSCPEKDELWVKHTLLHYTPFDPTTKRTIAKIRHNETGVVFRTSKGAPQVILDMDVNADTLRADVEDKIDEFASRGYRALGVGRDDSGDVPLEQCKWKMVGLLPLFDPPRHDTAETIRRAIDLGVMVKMVTGDQKAIAVETCRQLGMPTNILDTSILNNAPPPGISLPDLIYNTDGFAQVFPEHKFEIVKQLQNRGHVVGMTGDGVNDAPALSQANIGIAVDDSTDAARAAADIVLVSPGLSVIIEAIRGSREIFQRMKNYAMYSIAMTVRIVFTFGLITVIWNWYFPTILIVILAILNDGTIMTISKDDVKASPNPDSWKLNEVFFASINYGLFLTVSTVLFFYMIHDTTFLFDITNNLDNLCVNCNKNTCDNYSLLKTAPTIGTGFGQCCYKSGITNCTEAACRGLISNQINQYVDTYNQVNKGTFDDLLNDASDWPADLTDMGRKVSGEEQYSIFLGLYFGNSTDAPLYESSVATQGTVDPRNTNGVSYCQYLWGYSDWYQPMSRGNEIIGPGIEVKEGFMRGLIYMQVSISGQALIFVTRTSGLNTWFFADKPCNLLLIAFVLAQGVATAIGWLGFDGYPSPRLSTLGCGGHYTVVVWIWSIIWHFPLDLIKFASNYILHRGSKTYINRRAFNSRINSGHPSMSHRTISNRERAIRASRTVQ